MLRTKKSLAVIMFLSLMAGCAASTDRYVTTEVETSYPLKSTVSADESRMLEFWRNLEQEIASARPQKSTELEVYQKDSAPGVSEYRREYRESSRAPGSVETDRMLVPCRQLEQDYEADH